MPEDSYQVHWSTDTQNAVRELGARARQAGIGRQFVAVLRALDERLRREPLVLGEVYRLKGAVEERHAVQDFLAINFAVDRQRKFVLVRSCTALSGHGLS